MIQKIKHYAAIIIAACFFSQTFGQSKYPTISPNINPFAKRIGAVKTTPIKPIPISDSGLKGQQKIITSNGSIVADLRNENIAIKQLTENLAGYLSLNENNTFHKVAERTDDLGFTHMNFQQRFKGIPVDDKALLVHSRDGEVTGLGGQYLSIQDLEVIINIPQAKSLDLVKSFLGVTELITEYPIETVITEVPSENNPSNRVAYKVRIDSYSPFLMCNVFIDAVTGEILKKVNLIAHADTPGTGQTLYSGNQSITCDSYSGAYRLRENTRNIRTLNASDATGLTTSGFTGSTDFTSNSSSFSGVPMLNSFTISTASQSWWYNFFVDQVPDFYIIVKDGSNQVVYTSDYAYNTNPSITFSSLNILLTDPPYSVEIWDEDFGGNDDFGGAYTITTNSGTQSWSINGNSGNYSVGNSGNPALDVHWGMEMSYDFYLDIFSRDSYDGSGSIIKQYLNPPTLQAQYGENPNNASAWPAPYNFMQYGLGDGQFMNAVVGLDVEGHEFTHMVVANNGNGGLTYQGESGALNESFADIFGVCIEFYSGVNPDWLMGEDIMVTAPYLRSMSNPNGGDQPDTYGGDYWMNPLNLSQDHGGVHTNSGVQNKWFHLLCQGGSGTNDLGDNYSVSGIGISQARQIAYRNLTTYLSSSATYEDAYYGSLEATEDLYGNPSTQYTSVREAWYAVGIGTNPNNFCSGIVSLNAPSGSFSDGSGSVDYSSNSECKWVIAPPGATKITIDFTDFDTEAGYDSVVVYDGPDESYPIIAIWWGNTLPPSISTTPSVGAMCVQFFSDNIVEESGWSANYTSTGTTPGCDGGNVLTSQSASFNDGSGSSDYGNNQLCYWLISPPCANSITLSFSQFNTELNYDGIVVYDDWDLSNELAAYSGTATPPSLTSNTGKMLVVFLSDHSTTSQGFEASYTSTGAAYCSGTTTVNSSDYDIISDGSGNNNYCNNQNCKWLIQPPNANTITLNFTEFDLEEASTDGQSIYDAVVIYDGPNTNAPILGTFTGNNLPPSVTSSGQSMLVHFYSDFEVNKEGWSAYYTSTQSPSCLGMTTLTESSATFDDGSGNDDYPNNSYCTWLIQPENVASITLSFLEFNTEQDYDGVIVYDGADTTAPVLGLFTGTSLPAAITGTSESMFVEFLSDPIIRSPGWTANYTSVPLGISSIVEDRQFSIFPNPTDGIITIQSNVDSEISVQVFDMVGKLVTLSIKISKEQNQLDLSHLAPGSYLLKCKYGDSSYNQKIIVK